MTKRVLSEMEGYVYNHDSTLSGAENIVKKSADIINPDRSLMYQPHIDQYSGFINLACFDLNMVYMGSNRIINDTVIDKRVHENIENYNKYNKLLDFGTAILIVIRQYNNDQFVVADGQHRIRVLQILKEEKITDQLWISVNIKIVDTEIDANNNLMIFQKQHHSDMRLFSANLKERTEKEYIIGKFRKIWKNAFVLYDNRETEKMSSKHIPNYRNEVEKPHLSDGIVVDLYKRINKFKEEITEEQLKKINTYLGTLFDKKNVSKVDNCYFAYIKDDMKLIDAVNELDI